MAASSAKPPGAPFRFAARHARLDWRLLAELDCDRIWRETDIDALERALDTVCYGDLSVEDPRHVTGECSQGAGPLRGLAATCPVCALPKSTGGDALTRRPHAQGRAW